MFLLGIAAGFLSALLQSTSYICSSWFAGKYRSPLRLVIYSQLVMGMFCLPLSFFLFPDGLSGKYGEFLLFLGMWAAVLTIGQTAFFNMLRTIEPSRASSLLGLKIVVLALMFVIFAGKNLNLWQWFAVLLSSSAAMTMNWSGGRRFTPGGLAWLAVTLIFYACADLTETRLVRMPSSGNMIRNAIEVTTVCYAVLGVLTLPLLFRYRPTRKQFLYATPFAVTWFASQVTLLACFGILGTVFGNVIQSSRGMISILLGVGLCWLGHGKIDARISPAMWVRRGIAALLMAAGIILYTFAQKM